MAVCLTVEAFHQQLQANPTLLKLSTLLEEAGRAEDDYIKVGHLVYESHSHQSCFNPLDRKKTGVSFDAAQNVEI